MTLTQCHQTWYKLVDHKQGYNLYKYNNAMLEEPCLNSIHEKANNKVFVKSRNTLIISFEYVQRQKKQRNSGTKYS